MDHLKNLGADRKMILKKFLQEMGWRVYWIYVSQVRDKC